jgi:hypothetical protein
MTGASTAPVSGPADKIHTSDGEIARHARLVPGIRVLKGFSKLQAWMAGTSPAMALSASCSVSR